jgi:hypothetical protein
MSGITHSIGWWWSYFQSLFNIQTFTVTGSITLAAGNYELSVPTEFPNPINVFLSISEPPNGITTCIGDLNWVAATLAENGFVLYANIASNSCDISYVVQYDAADAPF